MRTKKAILTLLSDIIPQVLVALIGLAKSFFFIANLGGAMNGLYSLYSNIMMYLTILDGGLSSAILYRLYKPIAENDTERISSILSGSKRIFQIIGCAIFILGIVVSFFIPNFINDNPYDFFFLQSTFILYLISSVISYFTISQKTIFEGYQRKYITNTITQVIMISKGIIEVFLLMQGYGLYAIIGLLAISNLLTSLIIWYLAKRSYPNIDFNSSNRTYEMLRDVKDLLVHKVGTLIAYNIDIILISMKISLTAGAIYTAYQYIVDNITNIVGKLTYSAIAGVGDLISRENEKSYRIFKEFNSLCFFIGTIICVPLLMVINPFIRIWHQGRIETTFAVALLFILNLFYYIIRMPLITFVNSAGLFGPTKKCPIIESIVNLSLSLLLVSYYGLSGLLMGTFAAYLVSDYFIRPVIIYREIFKESPLNYYRTNVIFILIAVIMGMICCFISTLLPMTNYINWFLSSFLLFIINAGITFGIYIFIGQALFLDRIQNIFAPILERVRRNE